VVVPVHEMDIEEDEKAEHTSPGPIIIQKIDMIESETPDSPELRFTCEKTNGR